MTKAYKEKQKVKHKEKQKQKQKQRSRLDIPWHRRTMMTLDEKKRFHSLDSFFNAMVNEYKQKLIEEPIVPDGFTFLIIYKININTRSPQIEVFQYFPETEEQRTVSAIEEVMMGQLKVSASQPRMSLEIFNFVKVNLFEVERVETLIFQGSCYEGEYRIKAFDVIRDKELNITDMKETKKMDRFYATHTYVDSQLQDEVEKRKKEMSSR